MQLLHVALACTACPHCTAVAAHTLRTPGRSTQLMRQASGMLPPCLCAQGAPPPYLYARRQLRKWAFIQCQQGGVSWSVRRAAKFGKLGPPIWPAPNSGAPPPFCPTSLRANIRSDTPMRPSCATCAVGGPECSASTCVCVCLLCVCVCVCMRMCACVRVWVGACVATQPLARGSCPPCPRLPLAAHLGVADAQVCVEELLPLAQGTRLLRADHHPASRGGGRGCLVLSLPSRRGAHAHGGKGKEEPVHALPLALALAHWFWKGGDSRAREQCSRAPLIEQRAATRTCFLQQWLPPALGARSSEPGPQAKAPSGRHGRAHTPRTHTSASPNAQLNSWAGSAFWGTVPAMLNVIMWMRTRMKSVRTGGAVGRGGGGATGRGVSRGLDA